VQSKGKTRNYITYATPLLEGDEDTIVLKGMGLAIAKTVAVAEIIRRRVRGVYQQVEVGSQEIVDEWEPNEENSELPKQTTNRTVTSITITLSKSPLNRSHPGYHEPLPESQVKSFEEEREQIINKIEAEEETQPQQQTQSKRGGRGRRGGRGKGRRGRGGNRRGGKREAKKQEDEIEEVHEA